jgi:hypothetical protein
MRTSQRSDFRLAPLPNPRPVAERLIAALLGVVPQLAVADADGWPEGTPVRGWRRRRALWADTAVPAKGCDDRLKAPADVGGSGHAARKSGCCLLDPAEVSQH